MLVTAHLIEISAQNYT